MATRRPGPVTRVPITAVSVGRGVPTPIRRRDSVVTEEPMEIRLAAGRQRQRLTVTMRTPGNDFELTAGFLHSEGIVAPGELGQITYCVSGDLTAEQRYNVVTATLAADTLPDLTAVTRAFPTSSACGVCGRDNLDDLRARGITPVPPGAPVTPETIVALPAALRAGQKLFADTGGLHAAGLFTTHGEQLCVREDVGRHNAVDKVVGWAAMAGRLPLNDHILMVSGRAGYEIVQKALTAGIGLVCAVSAPSSLAVDLAVEYGMTLVGFLRDDHFNIYAGAERILGVTVAG